MTMLKLYNTKTRQKEDFAPIDPQNVQMYVCGPTVYDRAHLGNARPVIVFDTLFRLLRHVYGADHVTYVRNFTDVDDKINARAAESGRSIGEITAETTQWFLDDMAAVGAQEPTHMPRATQYIAQMVAMIEGLIAKGNAYAKEGHVLFRVRSYEEYGRLSGRSVDDMIAGARVEIAPFKEDPMDFVLWKPSDAATPGWDSPWGRGRPGWHIECSAMAHDLLGTSFDIHGGGNDLMFPHHENEIAQSKCAGHDFANVWMHNEMLQVEGKKMSKSLGNFFTVRDLLDQGVPGEVIRFVMLSTHYRKPMDWTLRKAQDANLAIEKMAAALGRFGQNHLKAISAGTPSQAVVDALSNDLNTHGALTEVRKFERAKVQDIPDVQTWLNDLYASHLLLGFNLIDHPSAVERAGTADGVGEIVSEGLRDLEQVTDLALKLDAARAAKDYETADRIRSTLQSAGVEVQSTPAGTKTVLSSDFDPAKLEALK